MRPRRSALVALITALVAFLAIGGTFGWQLRAYSAAQGRATAVTDGTIVQDGLGEYGDIRVRWLDAAGREHLQRFGIYNTDWYVKGQTFPVAYDPTDPTPTGLPADPDETSAEDDLVAPIVIAGAVTGLLLLAWAFRGLLFRWAVRRPTHPMTGSVLAGSHGYGTSTWLALAEPTRPQEPVRWQRVMWHPALAAIRAPVEVIVHGDIAGRHRIAVKLPGSVCLVPVGRLRHRPPRRVHLAERIDVRADLVDAFFVPPGLVPRRTRPWWRWMAAAALVGVVTGTAAGFAIGGAEAVWSLAVGGGAAVLNGWALTGVEQ